MRKVVKLQRNKDSREYLGVYYPSDLAIIEEAKIYEENGKILVKAKYREYNKFTSCVGPQVRNRTLEFDRDTGRFLYRGQVIAFYNQPGILSKLVKLGLYDGVRSYVLDV